MPSIIVAISPHCPCPMRYAISPPAAAAKSASPASALDSTQRTMKMIAAQVINESPRPFIAMRLTMTKAVSGSLFEGGFALTALYRASNMYMRRKIIIPSAASSSGLILYTDPETRLYTATAITAADDVITPLCQSIRGTFLAAVNTSPQRTMAAIYPHGSYPLDMYGSSPVAAGMIRYILSVLFDSI